MSLYVLTVSTPSHPVGMDWYFDDEDEYIKSVGLVEKLDLQATSTEDFIADFSEFQSWLQTQIKTYDP